MGVTLETQSTTINEVEPTERLPGTEMRGLYPAARWAANA